LTSLTELYESEKKEEKVLKKKYLSHLSRGSRMLRRKISVTKTRAMKVKRW
jgi:hypothetical protein